MAEARRKSSWVRSEGEKDREVVEEEEEGEDGAAVLVLGREGNNLLRGVCIEEGVGEGRKAELAGRRQAIDTRSKDILSIVLHYVYCICNV